MSARGLPLGGPGAGAGRAPRRTVRLPPDARAQSAPDAARGAWARRLEALFWSAFIFAAIGGFVRVDPLIEKLFWLAADAAAALAVLRQSRLYLDLLERASGYAMLTALAIVSTIWSLVPLISAYHGVQFAMTILVGVVMVARLGLDGLMRAVFAATFLAAVLSAALSGAGAAQSLAFDGAWNGVFTHKNSLGLNLVILFYTAAALALRGRRAWFYLAAAGLACAMLPFTRSTTSMIAALAVLLGLGLLILHRAGPSLLGFMLAALTALGAVAALHISSTGVDLADAFFDVTGKDQTLTGRTILWQFAVDAFKEAPLLGSGFKGYWESSVSSRLYLQFVIQQELWFFHNNFLEVAVAFGVVGLALFIWVLAGTLRRIIARFAASPDHGAVWCVCFAIHILVSMLSENPLLSNHSLPQALLVACHVACSRPAASRTR